MGGSELVVDIGGKKEEEDEEKLPRRTDGEVRLLWKVRAGGKEKMCGEVSSV